jgi:hypothetical protein
MPERGPRVVESRIAGVGDDRGGVRHRDLGVRDPVTAA